MGELCTPFSINETPSSNVYLYFVIGYPLVFDCVKNMDALLLPISLFVIYGASTILNGICSNVFDE